ncbi:MAG TPA: thioesterase family protein [Burkholderiales bacterium]|nr:thioesterase family protein [Burkholderiales bacterium]
MKPTLSPGLTFDFRYTVPENRTVPHLYPESALFQQMPDVLATGYLVGLMEWACIEAIKPHLDWPREQSLGTRVNFTHLAATPPGLTITVTVRLDAIKGRKLSFTLSAHDGVDLISEGTHERYVIDAERFNAKLSEKRRATRVRW